MNTFAEQFATHAATSFARQLALADFLGEHHWHVDIDAGTVDFGARRTYGIQLLGTEAEEDDTWLWAWANEESGLPDRLLGAVQKVRGFGSQHGIRELTDASSPLDVAGGHVLSMLSVGLVGNCCYYRGPYEGGALFFLVMGLPKAVLDPVRPERAITTISEVICQFEVDHRLMVRSFFEQQRFALQASDETIAGKSDDGTVITVRFDSAGRIGKIESTLRPAQAKKPWWKLWGA